MDTLLFVSPLNLSGKYLKSLSSKFLTNESKLEFINGMLSIKARFLSIDFYLSIFFSNPFGMTLTFT